MSNLPIQMSAAKNAGNTFFIELYILELRTGVSYIAACDEDIIACGKTWTAIPLSRGDISKSMDSVVDECEIKIGDVDDTKLAYVMNGFDFRGCKVTVLRVKYPDILTCSEYEFVFSGYIDSPVYSGGVFSCEIKNFFPNVEAPTRAYQFPCNSDFGDNNCCMNIGREEVVIQEDKIYSLTMNKSYPTNYWKNGVVSIKGESRNIVSSDGNLLNININFLQKEIVGQCAIVERGCDKTASDCDRHNNRVHYSGFLAIPFESRYR